MNMLKEAKLAMVFLCIAAFCGRAPKSVLTRHYADFSPEKLLEIYGEASLKVLR